MSLVPPNVRHQQRQFRLLRHEPEARAQEAEAEDRSHRRVEIAALTVGQGKDVMMNHMGARMGEILAAHDRAVEVVRVFCGLCDAEASAACTHRASDTEAARHFPGWIIRGVRGAKRTRCPKCAKAKE